LKRSLARGAATAAPVRVSRALFARNTGATTVKPTIMASLPFRRAMSTAVAESKPTEEAAVAEAPKGGLLDRGYEWYPVAGLGLAAAITQEWWIFDEYWITGGCFFGVLYCAYILGFDSIVAAQKSGFAKITGQTKAAFGIRLDQLKRYRLLEEFSLSHADELRNLYAEEAKVNAMAIDYQNLKHKLDTKNAVVAKLNSIRVLEDDARRQAIAALSKKAGEYVQTTFAAAPAPVKQKIIESGIQSIAPELTTRSIALTRAKPAAPLPADDPIKLLFDEFLATPRTFEQLGVENYVAKFMQRSKEAAAKAAKH